MLKELRPDCLYPKQTVIIDRDWEKFLTTADRISDSQLSEREASLQFDDPVNIQYTSGTTGYPKGATLSHHNILNNGFFIGERLKYTERDRVCLPVPFYHCFGMVLGNMAIVTHGACIVIPGEFFDPDDGRYSTSPCRNQNHRSGNKSHPSQGNCRRIMHPGLFCYAGILG